uniref:Uncharacterized protein n=1 Tax=Anguilla anguilla TaxID=7936 RepID=A0A0E9R6B8_ANGAN
MGVRFDHFFDGVNLKINGKLFHVRKITYTNRQQNT